MKLSTRFYLLLLGNIYRSRFCPLLASVSFLKVSLLIVSYVIDSIRTLLRRLYALRAGESLITRKSKIKKEKVIKKKQIEDSEAENRFFLVPRE
jgi:hypothetical protein